MEKEGNCLKRIYKFLKANNLLCLHFNWFSWKSIGLQTFSDSRLQDILAVFMPSAIFMNPSQLDSFILSNKFAIFLA